MSRDDIYSTIRSLPGDFETRWREYYSGPGFCFIHCDRLAEHLTALGVRHGPEQAIRRLQRTAGIEVTGILGHDTLKAVNEGTLLPDELIGGLKE